MTDQMRHFLFTALAMISLLAPREFLAQQELPTFDRINVFGNIELKLVKGETTSYEVLDNSEHLKISVDNHVLKIAHRQNTDAWRNRIIVEVTYTELDKLNASAGAVVEHDGAIASDRLELNFDTGASARLEVNSSDLKVMVGEGSVLTIKGTTVDLDAKATTGGVLKADDCIATHVEVRANTGATASVYASESLDAKAFLGGTITYFGDPEKVWSDESLGGSVKG